MATRKAGKKSTTKGKTTGSSRNKSGGKRADSGSGRGAWRKKLVPPQEPIIIGGGGSVEITFPLSFVPVITNPGRGHVKNNSVNLTQMVVLDVNGVELYRRNLNRTDTIIVCFNGSFCI
jgi:hypothetical protein